MSQLFKIHPENPQPRLLKQVAEILNKGGIIAYPTDSAYALGCHIGDKKAMDKICRIREITKNHKFTLMCPDLSDISLYAKMDNSAFRLLKKLTPGPYTFIFEATREVPRRLQNAKRKTIGIRVPDNKIARDLMAELGEPIMSVSLILPGRTTPLNDPEEIYHKLKGQLDAVIDGGSCSVQPTTVVHFENGVPEVTRIGQGDPSVF